MRCAYGAGIKKDTREQGGAGMTGVTGVTGETGIPILPILPIHLVFPLRRLAPAVGRRSSVDQKRRAASSRLRRKFCAKQEGESAAY